MNPRGGQYGRWPTRNRDGPGSTHFVPVAGTFSEPALQPSNYPVQDPRHTHVSGTTHHFSPSQHAYNGPPRIPISHTEFEQARASLSTTPYQATLTSPLFEEPVEYEGFIPAPGHENDHVAAPVTFDDRRYDLDYETSSEEDDSEEERITAEAALTHDREEDEDFSLSDDELEENPEDFIIEDADLSDEETVPKRGKPKSRGARGSRRGRPPFEGRGGSRGMARRGQKSGTKGRPKGKTGPRPVADPGPEFKELQRLANEAYMKEDYETAMSHAKEAIKLNPEIFSAYSLLSEIYAAMGNEEDSIGTLMGGAPTKRDKHLWYLLLERIERIDPVNYPKMTRDVKNRLSVWCLTSIISLDSDDWDARYRKLEIEVQRQRYSSCVILCRKMLKIRQHDTRVLATMAQMGTANDRQTALHLPGILECFETTINHFVSLTDPSSSGLDFSFLYVYLDLLDKAGDYNYALVRLKTLSRWIQNRATETYWDNLNDDREFDFEDIPRRIAVAEFTKQKKRRRGNYGKGLPLEIIIKMGLFRLRMTPPNLDEAMRHLNLLYPEDDSSEESLLWEDTNLFGTVAKALYETGHGKEALRFYEPLYRHGLLQQTLDNYIGMYTCYRDTGDLEKAEAILPVLIDWKRTDLKDWAALAKFFEDQGMMAEAMRRAEIVFRNRASMLLRNNGFEHYDELRSHFFKVRKQARGRHGARKARVKKYMKKLKVATRDDDTDQEKNTNERPSLGPLNDRPKKGLFRTKRGTLEKKPQTFMPLDEPQTLEGTDVPLSAIDHNIFRKKLKDLADNHADELAAARLKHREITASFLRLEELCDDADNGDQSVSIEYLSVARELIEEFSTFDIFYSDRRQPFRGYFRRLGSGDLWKESALMILAVGANQVDDGEADIELKERPDIIPEDFFGIHFDKWAEVFCRYALLLARQGEGERCFSVLDVASQSNVFYKSQKYTCDIELCRLSCALAVDNSQQVSASVRYLLKIYPFGTEIFRLYSAANRLCSVNDGYATGAASKVVMRWIKTIDYALLSPENRRWYNFNGGDRTQWMQQTLVSGLINQANGHDPALFALFGHLLMCTGSYTAALNYFFRAFAITPDDPVLNMSIGVAYFQHALKRLSENRQYQIQQGIAFMTRYYDLRTKAKIAVHQQEAEFNIGRVYHGLGLVTQAVPYYRRCIALGFGMEDEGSENFAAEAAYALQTIYVLSGDFEGALEVTVSDLVIE